MFDNLRAALFVPEIRKRVGFVFFAFAWFVFMIHVQLPNVNEQAWQRVLQSGAFYNLLGFLSGGALQKLSVIAMGITPYINASIIMQLMTVVLPQLEEMAKKGGEEGRKKISQYTRWLTIVLGDSAGDVHGQRHARRGRLLRQRASGYMLFAILAMVAGTLFLMWLGEQITDKGIGNGVSLIIFIGIVLRYPHVRRADVRVDVDQGGESLLNLVLYIVVAHHHYRRHHLHVSGPAPRARCSRRAASSAARCSRAARRTFRCVSTTPALSRSSSRSRSCCCRSRRYRGSTAAATRPGIIGVDLARS